MKTVELTLTHHYFHSKFQTLGLGSRKNNFFKKETDLLDCASFWKKELFFFFFFVTTVETVEMPRLDVAFGGKRKSEQPLCLQC